MSDDAQRIIAEQEASLNAKSAHGGAFSKANNVALADESGVTDAGLQEFDGADVTTARDGKRGGGTNAQWIPPSEGGADGTGSSSAVYEGDAAAGTATAPTGDQRFDKASADPGSYALKGDQIDAKTVQDEVIPSLGAPTEPQLLADGEDPRNPDAKLAQI